METRLRLNPGQNGTKKLVKEYGEKLVCVRYRYDAERKSATKPSGSLLTKPRGILRTKPEAARSSATPPIASAFGLNTTKWNSVSRSRRQEEYGVPNRNFGNYLMPPQ